MVASSVAAPVSLEAKIQERLAVIPPELIIFVLGTVEYVLDNIDQEVQLENEHPSEEDRVQYWLERALQYRYNERDRYMCTSREYFAQLTSFITELKAVVAAAS